VTPCSRCDLFEIRDVSNILLSLKYKFHNSPLHRLKQLHCLTLYIAHTELYQFYEALEYILPHTIHLQRNLYNIQARFLPVLFQ
jgi:hypothetical protein